MFGRSAVAQGCLIAAGLMLTAAVFAASDEKSTGDMGQNEKAVLEELNLARANPSDYANYMEEYKKNFNSYYVVVLDGRRSRTLEGMKAVDEAIAFLKKTDPVPSLSVSRSLTLSARDHLKDLGPLGMTGHTGTDKSQPADRIGRYGTPRTTSGEGIAFGPGGARSIVIQLIVDDGVPGREHRQNVFEPDYRVVGIAIGPHKTYEQMCVIDFADQMDEKNVAR